MHGLQEWIHKLEEGEWAKYIKLGAILLGFVAIAVAYNLRAFKNFHTAESMDVAQLSRNIAEGNGYSTLFIRPLSLHLLQKHRPDGDVLLKGQFDHPDLANPPAYPMLLGGAMKVLPINYQMVDTRKARFSTYSPERWIAAINQVIFFAAVVIVFFLARKLFDSTVAWASAAVLAGSELMWRFTATALPTMLLMLLFVGLVACLVLIEQRERRETLPDIRWSYGLAILAGALIGLGGLTRYSYLWVLIPVVLFLLISVGRFRARFCLTVIAAAAIVMAPWLMRNYDVSGTLFGTAGYAIYQETPAFPGTKLERSLNPEAELQQIGFFDYTRKLLLNTREIMRNELPRLGGNWISGFFLVALLIPFTSPTLSRLRIFLLGCLVIFVVAQALGRTHLSVASPEVNGENLLVILAPLVFMYGVALFFILLDQIALPMRELRYAATAGFVVVLSAPLIFSLLPPKTFPVAYPPYYPPIIRESASWLRDRELMMSDIPWAVAWYGHRQCTWLTLDFREQYYALSDDMKTVKSLYLSPQFMDSRFLTQMVKEKQGWGQFVLETPSRGGGPQGFPLQVRPEGFLPDSFYLTDWERWKAPVN
jgi:hypothetical protein